MDPAPPTVNFIEEYTEFTDTRVYLLIALARTRENPSLTSTSEVVFREVLKHEADIPRKYRKLRILAQQYRDDNGSPLTFRLYLTVNPRNTVKAYFNFRQRLNIWSQHMIQGDDSVHRKLARVNKHWMSELQKDSSKDSTRFLIDVDTKNVDIAALKQRLETHAQVHCIRETPNGYHVITDPFNYTEAPVIQDTENVEAYTDRSMFLEYLSRPEK